MDRHQRESVSVFDIMLVMWEEGEKDGAFRNAEGSMVVVVEVGVGIISVRRSMKVTLTNLMMHVDQMVGQASALNSYSVFPLPLLLSISHRVLVNPPLKEDLDVDIWMRNCEERLAYCYDK